MVFMTSDKVIVTYASNGREDYISALKRLIDSSYGNFDGDIIIVCPESLNIKNERIKVFKYIPNININGVIYTCPSHKELPYYFKSHLVKYASTLGYKKILWFDSTIFIMRNIDEIFESSKEHGFMSTNNRGQPLVWWTGDKALEKLKIPKELWEDESINQITACWMSFNLNVQQGIDILNEWWDFCKDKEIIHHEKQGISVRSCYKDHRHDQAIMSWILYNKKIDVLTYGDKFCYWAFVDDNTIIANRGVSEP